MFLIDTSRNGQPVYNALVNQSLDAYLINDLHLEGHGLICYINDPAVIIGRYQNAYAEVNLNYMKEHQIQLVRRTSGGGAVYHDRGNVIFENIVVGDTSGFRDFQWVGAPIVDALHDLGIKDAEVRGRNDMAINGKKFSGMAMVKKGDAYAAGGTLMFDLNGEVASTVLTPDIGKLEAKGIKSVDARITNIKPYLPAQYQSWTSEDFKNYLLCHLFGVERLADIPTYHLTDRIGRPSTPGWITCTVPTSGTTATTRASPTTFPTTSRSARSRLTSTSKTATSQKSASSVTSSPPATPT